MRLEQRPPMRQTTLDRQGRSIYGARALGIWHHAPGAGGGGCSAFRGDAGGKHFFILLQFYSSTGNKQHSAWLS